MYFSTMSLMQPGHSLRLHSHRRFIPKVHAMPCLHRQNELGCGSSVAGVHEHRNLNA